MARFKLKAGKFIGPDNRYELHEDGFHYGPEGSKLVAAPDVTYGIGEAGGIFVESDRDLVREFGKDKFELAAGESLTTAAQDELSELAPQGLADGGPVAAFPGGQVSEGFQVTTSDAEGRPFSGIMTLESQPRTHAEKMQAAKEEKRSARGPAEPMYAGQGGTVARTKQPGPDVALGRHPAETRGKARKAKPTKAELNEMTMEELRDHARKEEINLHGATTKDEVIDTIHKG